MKHVIVAGITLLAVVAAPAADARHPTSCGGVQYKVEAQIRTTGEDLRFLKDGTELARMTADHRLLIMGNEVVLDQPGRAAVSRYLQSHRALMADAKQIGIEGARLGTRAAFGAVRIIFASDANRAQFEAEVEAQAAAREARAESLCTHVVDLRREHLELSSRVPAFAQVIPLKD